jgi:probable HAF family extracellular repeat protein
MYKVTDLGTLGGSQSAGLGINASGAVVGSADVADGSYDAFLYDGTIHDLGTLGGTNSQAFGVNDSGLVTGYSETVNGSNLRHAFLYDGTMHDIGTPGGPFSEGVGINDKGQIAGTFYGSTPLLGQARLVRNTIFMRRGHEPMMNCERKRGKNGQAFRACLSCRRAFPVLPRLLFRNSVIHDPRAHGETIGLFHLLFG